MLETTTLRVAFGVIALTLFILFYSVTFRRTRAAYSGWWCIALVLFLVGASLYLLDGSTHQVWANPLGNAMLVAGAGSVWAAARSLRTASPSFWQLLFAPAVIAIISALDSPATNNWSGGAVFLAMMCLMFTLASFELIRLPPGFSDVRLPLAAASGLLSVFYFGRCIAFVAVGPKDPAFLAFFGSEVTTLINMVLLIAVSFSMAALSTEQVTKDLSARANQDGLTGLLNRQGFHDRATDELCRRNGAGTSVLILADLDHFKAVNDTYGHAAGDWVLQSFAAVCRTTVRPGDLVGRYGGEEFVFLLSGAGADQAQDITAEISRRLKARQAQDGITYPTVSYGVAEVRAGGQDLAKMIALADAAMYQAKANGRDTVARASDWPRTPTQ
ncbi:GGDEF domain-containing protein [Arthrobacter globiformis]|uniref:GGDEF domain-containing protein n=1 Tax=Arthrobacter globiformis TaxID=1665 RepID=UPI000B41951A|nr:diguanylate cyclase [Arthrobacter globiformis]